jgi:hypothetical protein
MNTAEEPSFRAIVAELGPLAGAIAGEGPPIVLLVGPLVLFALLLAAPFAFLLTLVVLMLVAAAALVALAAAIVGAPYLLIRAVRRHQEQHALGHDHPAQLVPFGSTRVAA